MQLSEVHDLFQLQARANGRSQDCREQYARYIGMLGSWLAASGRSTDMRDIDQVAVAEFLCSPAVREKRGGGLRKATSTNGIRSSLRTFFAWARDAGHVTRNAAALVRHARCSPVLRRVLSADDVRRLEYVLGQAKGRHAERDRVMFGVLLGCGLRVGSLAGLCAEDVNAGEILVRRAKNDAPVRVFAPRSLRPLLDRYVAGRSGPLFPLTTRHISRLLRRWCKMAKVQPCSAHAVRRTFGTRLYAACHDVLVVQRGLGHRSLSSTLCYVTGIAERLREVVGA